MYSRVFIVNATQNKNISRQVKKQVRFAQTSVFSTELYGMNNAWRERSKEKKIETERENWEYQRRKNWIMISLNELKYSASHLYINEFTHKIGSRTF